MKKHWRMRWDPNAEFVALKRLRVGEADRPFILPGEKVPVEVCERLGMRRIRRMFEIGMLAIADWVAPEPQREAAIKQQLDESLKVDSEKLAKAL